METKEVKIEVPQGYEVDKEKSTFEKIVFKKVNPLSELPESWEEYCEQTKNRTYYTYSPYNESHVNETAAHGFYGEFSTKERAEQFIVLGKLLQLHDYWVGNWKRNSDNIYIIFKNVIIATVNNNDFPLSFPTREMAERFKECFKDLIKEAYPLV